jgi:hypothetical protein
MIQIWRETQLRKKDIDIEKWGAILSIRVHAGYVKRWMIGRMGRRREV